jgi:hypothetical protein
MKKQKQLAEARRILRECAKEMKRLHDEVHWEDVDTMSKLTGAQLEIEGLLEVLADPK